MSVKENLHKTLRMLKSMMIHAVTYTVVLYLLSSTILSLMDGSMDPFKGYLQPSYLVGYMLAGVLYYFIKIRWLDTQFNKTS